MACHNNLYITTYNENTSTIISLCLSHTVALFKKIIQQVFDSFVLHNKLDKTPIIDSITDTPQPLKARFENKNSFQVIIRAASN